IAFIFSRFWGLTAYLLHQLGDHDKPRSAFVRQQEIILRCASTDAATLYNLTRLTARWWKRSPSAWPKLRAVILVGITLAHLPLTVLAGLYSSRVVIGNHVLASSPNCGYWFFNTTNSTNGLRAGVERYDIQYDYNTSSGAAEYASSCYEI